MPTPPPGFEDWLQQKYQSGQLSDEDFNKGMQKLQAFKQPAVQAGPTKLQSAALGAAQGATLGFGDEIGGAVQAGLGSILPESLGGYGSEDTRSLVDKFRGSRDAFRRENTAASSNPGSYLLGQLGGGIATAPALPGGSIKTLSGALANGAAYGVGIGLGDSSADLTKGEIPQAVSDMYKGGVYGAMTGGVLRGAGAATEAVSSIANALKKDSTVRYLTNFFKNVANRSGDAALQHEAASKLFARANELAGDATMPVDNMTKLAMDLSKGPQGPLSRGAGLEPEVQDIIDNVVALHNREVNPGRVSLAEMQKDLHTWTERVAKDWKNDPVKHRLAKQGLDAAKADLQAAVGDPSIGEAAQTLIDARIKTRDAHNTENLNNLIKNAASIKSSEGLINTRRMAELNSRARQQKVERWLSNDPKALEAWRTGIKATREAMNKRTPWLPKSMRSPKLEEALNNLLTHAKVKKIFSDSEAAQDFVRLMQPGGFDSSDAALQAAVRIEKRLTDSTSTEGDK